MPKKKDAEVDFFARLVADHSTDSIVVTDTQGRFVWANAAFTNLTGFSIGEVLGKKPGAVLQGADTNQSTVIEIRTALAERRPIRTEIYNYTKFGVGYWIDLSITPVFDAEGRHTHFMAIERDVTERREMQEHSHAMLQEKEIRKYERRLLAQTSEWLYSAKSLDELLQVVDKSVAALMPEATGQLYIYSNSRDTLDLALQWGAGPAKQHMAPDDCWALRRGRAYQFGRNLIEFPCSHIEDATSPYFCLPILAHGETIGLLHLAFPSIDLAGAAAGSYDKMLDQRWEIALMCAEQISLAIANVRLRMELHEQSVRDQLTGLWNRRWFLESARRDMARCHALGEDFGLITLDVDHFKRFNDRHGHDAGDTLLRAIGTLMTNHFAEPLSPCRLGGEEFVVICPGMDGDACEALAETFRSAVEHLTVQYSGADLPPITVSQGICVSPADRPIGLLDQMKHADEALYAAKDSGRNTVRRADTLPRAQRGGADASMAAE